MTPDLRPDSKQRRLLIITVLCYGTGYPIALWLNQPWGWILVTAGGVFLAWLLVLVVRRLTGPETPTGSRASDPDTPSDDQS
jgi:hypothetical protein